MVNNFDLIRSLLSFNSEDEFYYLQLLRRKKENLLLSKNNKVVKDYYISSLEYFDSKKEEIIKLCEVFNARAMIGLNKRSYRQCAFRSLEKITNQIMNEDYKSIRYSFSKVVGKYNKDLNSTWIIDIDDKEFSGLDRIKEIIEGSTPDGMKLITIIPSKNGYHLITKPFDSRKLKQEYPEINIHKDNPTNLYII